MVNGGTLLLTARLRRRLQCLLLRSLLEAGAHSTQEDFSTVVGKQVRLKQDPAVKFVHDDAEKGPLGGAQ